jgi:3-phosphoshikimate 1-carboxyvinyltransferase
MVRIDGVLLNPGRTAFLEVLRRMGADVEWGVEASAPEPMGWIEARTSRLEGTEVAAELVPALIDEVPALAVAAACADGTTRFSGAEDRIAAIAEGLRRLGAHVVEQADGLAVTGGPLHGAEVRSHGDHRIAMALAVAALAATGDTRLQEAACAEVSFPEFYETLRRGVEGA